jgi:DHA1 family purine base/nucleoside efflux pump-like MFS transporter
LTENPKTAASKLVVPALILSRVAFQPHGLITALLLIEIAQTYDVPIGVAGQLSSAVSIASVLMGLLMSFLAIKYSYRSLMLVGLAFYVASFIGSYLAPSFTTLLIIFSFIGIASTMVNPMASALVGTLLSSDRRAKIISWFFAGTALCVLFGSPYVTYVTGAWGWRANFLLFALPFASVALFLVYVAIPRSGTLRSSQSQVSITHSFREIFTNRSAVSCILCTILTEAAWQVTPVFGVTYMRQITQLPLSLSWLILVGTSTSFTVGSLMGGRLVDRLGRQRLAVISSFMLGALMFAYLNVSTPLVSAALLFFGCVFSSMRYTVSESLTLEQVPALRGTVMSLNVIALNIGVTVASGLGGLLLLFYGYGGLGFVGLFSVAAAAFYIFTVNDPLKS